MKINDMESSKSISSLEDKSKLTSLSNSRPDFENVEDVCYDVSLKIDALGDFPVKEGYKYKVSWNLNFRNLFGNMEKLKDETKIFKVRFNEKAILTKKNKFSIKSVVFQYFSEKKTIKKLPINFYLIGKDENNNEEFIGRGNLMINEILPVPLEKKVEKTDHTVKLNLSDGEDETVDVLVTVGFERKSILDDFEDYEDVVEEKKEKEKMDRLERIGEKINKRKKQTLDGVSFDPIDYEVSKDDLKKMKKKKKKKEVK